jgi:signal transduction histidine kinase
VRRRIVVLAVLAAVLATSLFGVPLAVGVGRYFLSDERTRLERVADKVAIAVAADLAQDGAPVAVPLIQHDADAAIYDRAGRRLAGEGPVTGDVPVQKAVSGSVSSGDVGGQLVVTVPVTDGERVTGAVRVSSDYSAVRRRIAWAWTVMAGLAALAVVATWSLARRQARRLAAPLEALSRTARRLGDGDFSVRTSGSGIPEIDSAGSSLDSTAERLGALVAREREFAATASHQLRTPLTGLRLGLETALDSPDADPRAAIEAAIQAADRLERTIADLLSPARDPGRDGTPLATDHLLREIEETWRPVLAAQGRALRMDAHSDAPSSTAAPAAVRQVLGVLLDNAARHGRGTVTVTVRDAGGALALDVQDEGAVVTDGEPLPRRHDGTGSGIGLALARRLAEAEGGRLRLTRPDPAVFTLLLPSLPDPPGGPDSDRPGTPG